MAGPRRNRTTEKASWQGTHSWSAQPQRAQSSSRNRQGLGVAVTEDGLAFEDGRLERPDGRTLAWRWIGEPGWTPVLRLQGTPGSRLSRHPNPAIQRDLRVRYLLGDRPGYGGSTRLPGPRSAGRAEDPV